VEHLPVPAVVLEVGDVVHRRRHEVDGDEVDPTALHADQRQPRWHQATQPFEQREEVVGPVDLVDLAGAGVADHDPGAVDPPGHLALVPGEALGGMFGREVGMVQPGGLVQHVLAEGPWVAAGHGDRGDVVEPPRPDAVDELHHVAGAVDVGRLLRFRRSGHVVDRGEVENVVDPAFERCDAVVGQAQSGLGQVTDDGLYPTLGGTPLADEGVEPGR
jgi:hypothetical protein